MLHVTKHQKSYKTPKLVLQLRNISRDDYNHWYLKLNPNNNNAISENHNFHRWHILVFMFSL